MRELGIPVDVVGGTSIGSMIGGIFAETPDPKLEVRAKSWFMVGLCKIVRSVFVLGYVFTVEENLGSYLCSYSHVYGCWFQ